MSTEYREWLAQQTSEKQAGSLRHLRVCKLYGKVQRARQDSAAASKLSNTIQQYYANTEEKGNA